MDVKENTKVKTWIKASVTREEWRGNDDHPYKKHAVLQLAGVPSLLLMQGQQVMMRADDLEHYNNEDLMQEFKDADLNNDGKIQFLEFLRALCKKDGTWMPPDLNPYETMRIWETVEFKHMTREDKEEMLKAMEHLSN